MKELVEMLEMEISRIKEEQEDYHAEGNSADYYSQTLYGKIKGLEIAIQTVKKAQAKPPSGGLRWDGYPLTEEPSQEDRRPPRHDSSHP